jgi:hypothetical protein
MSVPIELIRSLPLAELRRLVIMKENQDQIQALMEKRDTLLEEARMIQNQIDELIELGSGRPRRRRKGPSVKALCIEALEGSKNGMTAADVKNTILEKHPHRNNRTFYNQVFIALTRSVEFKKLKNGNFILAGKGKKA